MPCQRLRDNIKIDHPLDNMNTIVGNTVEAKSLVTAVRTQENVNVKIMENGAKIVV